MAGGSLLALLPMSGPIRAGAWTANTRTVRAEETSPDAPLDPPVTVRVGRVGAIVEAGQIIALERGYFTQQGIQVEYSDFDTAAVMIPALATGHLDVGGGTVSAGLFNAVARGVSIKMVGPQARHMPGASSLHLMLRKDLHDSGEVTTYADLRGRKIAIPAQGSVPEFVAAAALDQGGLAFGDAEFVVLSFPDMTVALANGAIDAAVQVDPAATQAVKRGAAVKWREAGELRPGVQAAVVAYAPQFAERTEVARRWMVAYLQGVREYCDAFRRNVNREEIVAALTSQTTIKDPALYDQMGFSEIDPNGHLEEADITGVLDWFTLRGYVREELRVSDALDLSFAEYAVQRLGRYA